MADAKDKVTFRSRYKNYSFRGLQFSENVAQTSDQSLIAAAKADQHYGREKDFWIDEPVDLPESGNSGDAKSESNSTDPPKTEPPKTDSAGDDEGKDKGKDKGKGKGK